MHRPDEHRLQRVRNDGSAAVLSEPSLGMGSASTTAGKSSPVPAQEIGQLGRRGRRCARRRLLRAPRACSFGSPATARDAERHDPGGTAGRGVTTRPSSRPSACASAVGRCVVIRPAPAGDGASRRAGGHWRRGWDFEPTVTCATTVFETVRRMAPDGLGWREGRGQRHFLRRPALPAERSTPLSHPTSSSHPGLPWVIGVTTPRAIPPSVLPRRGGWGSPAISFRRARAGPGEGQACRA